MRRSRKERGKFIGWNVSKGNLGRYQESRKENRQVIRSSMENGREGDEMGWDEKGGEGMGGKGRGRDVREGDGDRY